MGDLIKMVTESGFAGVVIVTLGIFGLAIIVERVKTLYFDYALKSDTFMEQVRSLILQGKIEQAVSFCGGNEKTPLAHVVKRILERADRDDKSLDDAMEIGASEVVPKLSRRLGFLAMISNVSTLVGLLGTISGLIMAFNAVSFADPSQKQMLLAQGISVAMNTTALGLSVAIPVMIAYAFLNARQNRLYEEIFEHSQKTLDILKARTYSSFSDDTIWPSDSGKETVFNNKKPTKKTPPKVAKAS